jgi:hypothetical protein
MKTLIESNQVSGKIPGWLEIVRQHVDTLHFGVVQIVVHDSHVTQIDKTERVRLEKNHPKTF